MTAKIREKKNYLLANSNEIVYIVCRRMENNDMITISTIHFSFPRIFLFSKFKICIQFRFDECKAVEHFFLGETRNQRNVGHAHGRENEKMFTRILNAFLLRKRCSLDKVVVRTQIQARKKQSRKSEFALISVNVRFCRMCFLSLPLLFSNN